MHSKKYCQFTFILTDITSEIAALCSPLLIQQIVANNIFAFSGLFPIFIPWSPIILLCCQNALSQLSSDATIHISGIENAANSLMFL